MRTPMPFLTTPNTSTATAWMRLLPQNKKFSIGVGTTATGTPAGQLSIEVSNHGNNAVAGAVYPATIAATSGACAFLLDNIQTAADYVRLVWTRSSGGTASVFTDDSGLAGTFPGIVYKE